jgi:hypothetical protein
MYDYGMFVIQAVASWLENKAWLCRNIIPTSRINWMKQFARNKQIGRKGSGSCNITEPAPKTALYKDRSFEGCDPLQAIGEEDIKLLRVAPPTSRMWCCTGRAILTHEFTCSLIVLSATNYLVSTARMVPLVSIATSTTPPAAKPQLETDGILSHLNSDPILDDSTAARAVAAH